MATRIKREYSAQIELNLLELYNSASARQLSEGMLWYQDAHSYASEIASRYGTSVDVACGVIAALSPGSNWDKNRDDADTFLFCFFRKKLRGQKLPTVGSYGWNNITKAERICKGELPLDVLGGLKVRAFYECLVAPDTSKSVCIDRHAKCAAIGQYLGDTVVTPSEYPWISEHYRNAAKKLQISASQLQAVVWVVWRETKEDYYPVDFTIAENQESFEVV